MQENPWKQLDSKVVYSNPWISVREDTVIRPDGTEGIYGVVDTTPGIFIVAINDRNEVMLTGQWRYATNQYSWEIPGGSSEGDNLLEAAKRELLEESGLTATKWTHCGTLQSFSGIASEMMYVFLAQDLTETDHQKDPAEIAESKWVPLSELNDWIKNGTLNDSQSLSSLSAALLFLEK